MRHVSELAILLFASSALFAQSAQTSTQTATVPTTVSFSCPVRYSVQRNSPVEFRQATATIPGKVRAQSVQLNINPEDLLKITNLEIVVHGFPDVARSTPVSDPDSGIAETFQLARDSEGHLATSLQTRGITTVQSVELTKIEFADGSVWRWSAESRCRVAPDLLVLIAGAK